MLKILSIIIIACLFQCKSVEKTTGTATLDNTYWRLAEMNGKPIVTPADAKEVHIMLKMNGAEKNVSGFAGCNTIGGSYKTEENKISFIIISTKMYCQDRMEVEGFLTAALTKADNYSIDGETLLLYQGKTKLATFKSVYFK